MSELRLTKEEVAGFAVKMYGGTGKEPFPSDLVKEIEYAVLRKVAEYVRGSIVEWDKKIDDDKDVEDFEVWLANKIRAAAEEKPPSG